MPTLCFYFLVLSYTFSKSENIKLDTNNPITSAPRERNFLSWVGGDLGIATCIFPWMSVVAHMPRRPKLRGPWLCRRSLIPETSLHGCCQNTLYPHPRPNQLPARGLALGAIPLGWRGQPREPYHWMGWAGLPWSGPLTIVGLGGAVSPASHTRRGDILGNYTNAGGWGESLNKSQN